MKENTAIEWTDATWNPTTGCTKLSAGCDNCYAHVVAQTKTRDIYLKRSSASRFAKPQRAAPTPSVGYRCRGEKRPAEVGRPVQ